MAVGKKAGKWLSLLAALAVLLFPINSKAADVSELYHTYGKDYEVEIPEDTLNTITAYDSAKKYVSMYNAVVSSEYDTTMLSSELEQLEEERARIADKLLAGYTMDMSALLELEDRYVYVINRIDDIESSLVSYNVEVSSIDAGAVPSYSEYSDAMREKNDILAKQEIGNIENLQVPVQSSARLLEHSDDMSTYKVIDGTGVLSLFNGVVDDVFISDEYGLTVVVNNQNGVKTHFCNMEFADVVIGETVYQNQRLGYVYGTKLLLRMQLGDDFVDVSKLLHTE